MTQDEIKRLIEEETDVMREAFGFMESFANDILIGVADRLSTETAYNLLQGLTYEEYAGVIRKVITGYVGRAN